MSLWSVERCEAIVGLLVLNDRCGAKGPVIGEKN